MSPAADPPDGPRPLVDSTSAAQALRTSPEQLDEWAGKGIVSPARVDDDGAPWWNLHDLRRQLATYLDEHRDDRRR